MNRAYADANWRHLPVDSTGGCRQLGCESYGAVTPTGLPLTRVQPLAIDRIFEMRVPAIIPGRYCSLGSKMTRWVRLPAASMTPAVLASTPASTPAPESPSKDGPYQAKELV